MIGQRDTHFRRFTHIVIAAVDRRRNAKRHVVFRHVHTGGRRVMGGGNALTKAGAAGRVADSAVGIRLGPPGMVVAGGEIDIGMAAAADFGGRVVLPVVDLVAGSKGQPAVGVADHAFLDVLGIGDAAKAHATDLIARTSCYRWRHEFGGSRPAGKHCQPPCQHYSALRFHSARSGCGR